MIKQDRLGGTMPTAVSPGSGRRRGAFESDENDQDDDEDEAEEEGGTEPTPRPLSEDDPFAFFEASTAGQAGGGGLGGPGATGAGARGPSTSADLSTPFLVLGGSPRVPHGKRRTGWGRKLTSIARRWCCCCCVATSAASPYSNDLDSDLFDGSGSGSSPLLATRPPSSPTSTAAARSPTSGGAGPAVSCLSGYLDTPRPPDSSG